ncbi:hypothetical protein SPRG_06823 [Saprolegnia parasitica CBS 223.65]|uniref:Amino acid transporter transmembrane domain-containing protein n=1 Tax=Saprolegnia parasitica (strain CBS 223.65) TaxID=695850 RepID=A0A067CLX4_SAPPC|nr:hypothetical protein SPRG_06823 [Saprolegnia parasitica CBS 223.65]KDO27556.1 hypothetical protein SPRG_06823 [Saprolegnia parasitica CBS 223.65]|eukprot:XP_012201681.1 hypothetical protein SPRG_06823 [Saprolegnia parasitica CBS 223.65]
MAFLTQEDVKMSIALFCCMYGVGSIGAPGNFAMVGYGVGIVIVVGMCIVNMYASWCMSKVLLIAPKHVKTFGDIGEWSMGIVGRYAANLSQLIVCVMIPTIFLVLGGSILSMLFPLTFKIGVWILFMALALLPVCLYPTLKEGTGVIFAGALGAVVADGIALAVLVHNVTKQNDGLSPPPANINFDQFSTAVGNLALTFGAGTIIPVLHREHSDPTRLPRVIIFTYTLALVLILVVGIVGFAQVGCQIPFDAEGYLLFVVATPYLGFISDRGTVILALVSMLVHNMVAYGVVIFPSFFILERRLLGLHPTVIDSTNNYNDLETPEVEKERKSEARASLMDALEFPSPETAADYSAPGAYLKASILRTLVVAVSATVAIIGQRDLTNLANFTGSSMILLCCVILPVTFYAKVYWQKMSAVHKVWAILVVLLGAFIAIYGSIYTGKILFSKKKELPLFPYCEAKYQTTVYTNRSHKPYKPVTPKPTPLGL